MTNGEKIKEIFPNSHIDERSHTVFVGYEAMSFRRDWWNAEYKELTTKNDLGVDCVSRQFMYDLGATCIATRNGNGKLIALGAIEELPSVTPQEPRWIPVSERLPDAGEDVLVTVNLGSARVVGEDMYSLVEKYGFEGYGKDVIAWMSLPKPYSEVEE